MANIVGEELPRAVEYLRKTQAAWVFNRGGKTICLTVDPVYAAFFAESQNLSLSEAAEAMPLK
jgi:hypothetical protein